MAKKKKLWIPVIALILAAAVVAAYFLIPKTPQQVMVYSYDMVGYVNYYTGGSESYGMVTTDRVQTAYVTDTQQVTEIKVYQGQQVKKGDVLYLYDTTLSDLELERKSLSIEQMQLNLTSAKAELKALKAMKPMVLKDQTSNSNTTTQTDATKIPANAVEGKIYNADSGKGTQLRPYYVWIKTGTRVTEDMILNYLAQKDPQMTSATYVVFRVATRAGAAFTQEYGVCYQQVVRQVSGGITTASETLADVPALATETDESTEPTTESTEPTDASTEPTTESTEPTDPSTEPTTESTEPTTESTEPTDPSTDPTQPSTEPTEPVQTEKYIQMSFFQPGSVQQEDVEDEIIWNSGYTSSELQTMRTEKQQEINELEFSIKMGKAEFEIMKKEADNGQVVAEFDGVVTTVLEPENAAELDSPMIKVAGGGGFYVEGSVSELDLSTIEVGQKVTVTSWDTYMTYEGTIAEIGSYPAENENNYYGAANLSYYPYKVFIDETADLQEGYYVSMVYQTGTENEEGIMYLENAFLRTENGESFVYVQGADGLLEKRVVQIGENDGYMTQILSGLSETDLLAFPYGNEVQEGAPTVEGTWEDLYGY